MAKPCLFLLGLCVAGSLRAQSPTMGAYTPAGVATAPGPAGGGFEQYNPFNGYMGAAIPLHHIGGRGEAGFDLVWNLQPGWLAANLGTPGSGIVAIDPYPSNNITGAANSYALGGPGSVFIRTGASWQSCGSTYAVGSTITTLVFNTASGSQITLTDTATSGAAVTVPFNACTTAQPTTWEGGRGSSFRSTDNSQIQFNSDANVEEQHTGNAGYGVATVSGYLVFPNGVTYRVDNSLVSWIRDRNGNKITLGYGGPATAIDWYLTVPALTQITDSLNRTTNLNYSDSSCGGCLTISYPGAGGATRQVKVMTGSLASNLRSGSGYSIQTIAALFPTAPGQPSGYNYNPTVATSIQWPDGSQHTFQYNPYGELAAVTLPAGGSLQYDYGDGSNGTASGYQSGANGSVMIYRRLQERREYASWSSTTTMTSRTHHTVTAGSGQTQDTVKTFDPSNNTTAMGQVVHTLAGSPLDALSLTGTGCNAWNEGLETQTDSGIGSTLVTVVNSYVLQSGCMNNPQLSSRMTELGDGSGLQMKSVFTFDQYGNITDQKDYDWGSGSPSGNVLRDVSTYYLYQNSSTYAGTSLNLIRLPYTQTVKDGGGNQIAQTIWYYDQYSLTDDPGISLHDSSYGTNWLVRGNVTNIWRWLNTGNTYLGKVFSYDIAGNVVNSHNSDNTETTTYAYNSDGQNQYAFPTSVTDALGHATTAVYDYNAGKPTSVTDALNDTTHYVYSDGFDRPTTITEPIGAQTNIFYYTPYYTVINRDRNSPGDGAFQTQEVSDGLGRPIEHRQTVDSQNFIATDRTYDAMGRVACNVNPTDISEPSFTSADGLNYPTCMSYDALSRVTNVNTPDGNNATASNYGNSTTYTDPAGKARKAVSDGLGRVTQVVEDPGTSNWITNYAYDVLGDLTSVLKCSAAGCGAAQARAFTFDSLGRLISAFNPESGTVSYSYGTANTLQSRTDARNSATSYTYDATNRLTGISYADGTPAVSYSFDAAGRLTQASAISASVSVVNNYPSYDPNGRPFQSNVVIGGQTYSFNYTWDLSGNLQTETYPSGRVLTSTYDGAQRATAISGALAGTTTPYVNQAVYWPSGALNYWQYGNNVWPAEYYTKLLQPDHGWSTLGNTGYTYMLYTQNNWNANPTVGLQYECYGAQVSWSNLTCLTQNYSYDNLNRLTSVVDSSSAGTNYSRNFQFDEFGNMSLSLNNYVPQNGFTPIGGPSTNPFNTSNNQVLVNHYDARGNATQLNGVGVEPINVTYDGESRETQTVDTNANGLSVSFTYDAFGQRVQQVTSGTNSSTTVYVHDALGQLAAEYSSVAVTPACTTCYLSYDQAGSVRLITNESGGIVARHDYLPFGEEIPSGVAGRVAGAGFGASANVTQMFTGQERDGGNAVLDYFNARHMSAALERFMQPDPQNAGADILNPQSWNGYAYVLGNPLGLVDPSGMDTINPNQAPTCEDTCFSTTVFDYSSLGGFGAFGGFGGLGGGTFRTPYYGTDPLFTDVAFGKGYIPTVDVSLSSSLVIPAKNATCYSLAAGQTPAQSASSSLTGWAKAAAMFHLWLWGQGPVNSLYGPGSSQSQQMLGAYHLGNNISDFLSSGNTIASGHQDFGAGGYLSSGRNATAQFVGSYDFFMSRSGGNLNITLTNSTTAWSFFEHVPFLNPNPPDNQGAVPMGRVNQTFDLSVPCP